jgi:hypothetical protein
VKRLSEIKFTCKVAKEVLLVGVKRFVKTPINVNSANKVGKL